MSFPTQQYIHASGEIVQAGVTPHYTDDISNTIDGSKMRAYAGDYIVIHSDGRREVYPPHLFHALHRKS